jgi:hypothetical protein
LFVGVGGGSGDIFHVPTKGCTWGFLNNESNERIDFEIFGIIQKPNNKNNEAKRMITKD